MEDWTTYLKARRESVARNMRRIEQLAGGRSEHGERDRGFSLTGTPEPVRKRQPREGSEVMTARTGMIPALHRTGSREPVGDPDVDRDRLVDGGAHQAALRIRRGGGLSSRPRMLRNNLSADLLLALPSDTQRLQ